MEIVSVIVAAMAATGEKMAKPPLFDQFAKDGYGVFTAHEACKTITTTGILTG